MLHAFRGKAPQVDATAFVEDSAQVVGDVRIGARSSVWFAAVVRGDINSIAIGCRANVQDGCVLHVTAESPVVIEDDVTLGHRAVVHGARIGRGALIGIGAVVLDGAEVGAGALVAAGAVVTPGQVVPPRVMVSGVPARVVRELTRAEVERLAMPARNYVGYAEEYSRERGSG